MSKPNIKVDEVNLEDLILLGEDKKIPIEIEFPTGDGKKVKAKALVKQLTLKEIGNMNVNQTDMIEISVKLLEKALFKMNGENFTRKEIETLPLGVINAISDTIMDLSGFKGSEDRLKYF